MCTENPYRDYEVSGFEAPKMTFNYQNEDVYTSGFDKIKLFTDYQNYSSYHFEYNFDIDYNKKFFETNNLLIIVVSCNSSDNMMLKDVLINDGKLYPLFDRNKIKDGDPVAEDFIVLAYYVEIPESDNYNVGEIIYNYR